MPTKKQEAIKTLRTQYIKPSTTLIINIVHTSASGMSRRMQVYTADKKTGRLWYLTALIADLLGYTYKTDTDTITVKGCGMDMAFWLANTITHELFNESERKHLTGNGGGCLNYQTIY